MDVFHFSFDGILSVTSATGCVDVSVHEPLVGMTQFTTESSAEEEEPGCAPEFILMSLNPLVNTRFLCVTRW